MINYYEYETSPRKEEPEFMPKKTKKTKSTVQNQAELKKKIRQAQIAQSRKNIKHIVEVGLMFTVLLVISYRYALINSRFTEKENLKSTLASIQKQNAQLQVSIEQGMNINNIEQAAKEKLGMQKLENNQKVYINLQKKDYTESSKRTSVIEENETWWQKFLNTLRSK